MKYIFNIEPNAKLMKTITVDESLSQEKLIEMTKEHIEIASEHGEKTSESDGHVFIQHNDQSLYNMLLNIITGALKPVRRVYVNYKNERDEEWVEMNHLFWCFRNILMEDAGFNETWENPAFRKAMMIINLAIESLYNFKKREKFSDEDFRNISCYFLGDEEESKGFLEIKTCIEKIPMEIVAERWEIEPRDFEILRLSLRVIIHCQKVWLSSKKNE